MNITSDFFTSTMKVIALKVARLAQTDREAAADYFDMHAGSLSDEDKEAFGNAVIDAAIKITVNGMATVNG